MKLKKLVWLLHSVTLGACLSPNVFAAEQQTLWGNADNYSPTLKNFSAEMDSYSGSTPKRLQIPSFSADENKPNTFQFNEGHIDDARISHTRYNQRFHGLPVWQSQVVYHVSKTNTEVTGSLLQGIEQDITDFTGKISMADAKKIAMEKNSVTSPIFARKIIYFDNNTSKAVLAYYVSYQLTNGTPSIPYYIINATTGEIIEKGDALPCAGFGKGPGGVKSAVVVRDYQFSPPSGTGVPSVPNRLGVLDVKNLQNGMCTISNPSFKVFNLKNIDPTRLGYGLPVSTSSQTLYQLSPFVYWCTGPNAVGGDGNNPNDNGYAPVNDGQSPVNDVTYFVRQTFNMLKSEYKLVQPVGTQLPVEVYTHIANYNNAFACGTHCMQRSGIVGQQQVVFGNGDATISPLTEGDIVAHEFGHLVTDHFSGLMTSGQPGAINEAFSDMTGMALNYYLRTKLNFTWYWDGANWTSGSTVSKTGKPVRYLYEPTLDGVSIGNAADFRLNLNTHNAAGVYNKAFYLLSTTTGWSIEKAYQVMLDANMNYWTPYTDFNTGACGVRDAAIARSYSGSDVETAFAKVGVKCPRPALSNK